MVTLDLTDSLTVPEAARLVKRGEETIRRHLRSGWLVDAGQHIGHSWFVRRNALIKAFGDDQEAK